MLDREMFERWRVRLPGRDIWLFIVTGLVMLSLSTEGGQVARNCRQTNGVMVSVREIIREAQRFAATSPVRSQEERERDVRFYSDAFARLRTSHC